VNVALIAEDFDFLEDFGLIITLPLVNDRPITSAAMVIAHAQ
jgi:hypothetical protein